MASSKDGVKAGRRREHSDIKDGDSVKSGGGGQRKRHSEAKASEGTKEHSEAASQRVQAGDGGHRKRQVEAKAGDGVKADGPKEKPGTASDGVKADGPKEKSGITSDGVKADGPPKEKSGTASDGIKADGRADEANHGAQTSAPKEHSDMASQSVQTGEPKGRPDTAVEVKANDGVKRSESKPSNGSRSTVVTSVPDVPVTVERKPFVQSDDKVRLPNAGTARANIAATQDRPEGTTQGGWADRHQNQTILQQHVDFFDQDHDGVIWPVDTFKGFYALGYGIVFSLFAAIVINGAFSYPTLSGYLPDPLFRIYMRNIHKDKHGSDSGTYDNEGRFVPQKFEDIFSKYADGRDYVTVRDVLRFLRGQRLIADPFGWFGALFEWLATYLLLWPANGRMAKEDIRGVYDGSIFYTIAARQQQRKNRR